MSSYQSRDTKEALLSRTPLKKRTHTPGSPNRGKPSGKSVVGKKMEDREDEKRAMCGQPGKKEVTSGDS